MIFNKIGKQPTSSICFLIQDFGLPKLSLFCLSAAVHRPFPIKSSLKRDPLNVRNTRKFSPPPLSRLSSLCLHNPESVIVDYLGALTPKMCHTHFSGPGPRGPNGARVLRGQKPTLGGTAPPRPSHPAYALHTQWAGPNARNATRFGTYARRKVCALLWCASRRRDVSARVRYKGSNVR